METCQPGPQSGCTIRGKGKPVGNLSCAEVDRRLEALGASAGWKKPIQGQSWQTGFFELARRVRFFLEGCFEILRFEKASFHEIYTVHHPWSN